MSSTSVKDERVPKLRGVLAMIFVSDVARSIEFYKQLGFTAGNTHEDKGKVVWALLQSPDGHAQLMLANSARPMNPGAQDMLFYLYAENVEQYREELKAKGLAVGPMQYPFYSPRGEFRLEDPDGWSLFIAHAD
jgi:catechol 2,3-dioxygenase-like lactoylglutathione lyase family enzyme